MHGEHSEEKDALYAIKQEVLNTKLDKAMKAKIDIDKIRKAGY